MKETFKQTYKKKELIDNIILEFEEHKPKKEVVKEYREQLLGLSLKDVKKVSLEPIETDKRRRSIISLLRGLNKKKAFMVHMSNKNKTMTHFVISRYKRSFKVRKNAYMINPEVAFLDTTYKMTAFNYYEGCVMPFVVEDVKGNAEIKCDPQAFKILFKFEYVELLASISKVKDLMRFILAAVILTLVIALIILGVLIKGFGWI